MSSPSLPWLTWLDTCDSTNAWAARHLSRLYHGQVIYTPQQTHGRGQYGRRWVSGGFTASFVLANTGAIAAPSLLAGLAVVQAVELLVPALRHQLQIKWPNDVMAAGKKLAGILCEQHQAWLVVGVGLNRHLPEEALPQAVSLQALSANAVPTVLELLVAVREELLWCWSHARDGLTAVQQRDFLQGRSLCVSHPQQPNRLLCQGEGAGINDSGHLRVRLANGEIMAVASGHVTLAIPPL